MNAQNNHITVTPYIKVREFFEEKQGLFGMLRWVRIVRKESIGEELRINTGRIPEKIVLNNVEYVPAINLQGTNN